MAIFNGREALVKSLSEAVRPQDRKGLEGEIRIGDILAKYLPSNTYIIAQPSIGEMQPDFLIISPEFGFRIVEIKNFNIRYINKVHSNGSLITEYGQRNPLNQVKQHVQALSNYLVSNKANARISDPYRLIGYCVIHAGFSRREFEYKFSTTLSNWSEDDREKYFKYHLFNDELNHFITNKIEKATKFPYQNVRLTEKTIFDIAQTVESSPSLDYNDMLTEKVSEQEAKIASVNQNIDLLREEMNKYKTEKETSNASGDTNKRKSSRLFSIILVAGVIIATLFVVINMGEEPSNHNDVVEDSIANSNMGDSVRLEAQVERFYFHKESETKFLTLTDGKNKIEAVIFDSIKVPFIEEGMNYKFEGVIKESKTNGEVELHVNKVIE